jgi:signal transduction histidine kinase
VKTGLPIRKNDEASELGAMNYFKRTPIRFRTILLVAIVFSTLFLFQSYLRHNLLMMGSDVEPFNWTREMPVPYLNYLFWALLVPLVYRVLDRWPLTSRPVWRNLLMVAICGLAIGSFHEVFTSCLYYAFLIAMGDFKLEREYLMWALNALPASIMTRFLEYWALAGILYGIDTYRKVQEKHRQLVEVEHQLQSAQLNALRKQLQPHFLFNTLNTVSALMDEDIRGARKVLARLGQLLRITLDKEQRDRVTLAREVDYISNYLDIESMRFRDRLHVRYIIPEDLSDAMVPSMMLQPLVENAVKHGPDSLSAQVELEVRAERKDDRLIVTVSDNGKGCADVARAMDRGGIGLRNVKERLKLLYNGQAHMDLASPGGRGFQVRITLPYEGEPTPIDERITARMTAS